MPLYMSLSIFNDIYSVFRDFFNLWADFFANIGAFFSFLWSVITQWFKFGNVLTSALQYLPELFDFLPDILVPFAFGTLTISIIFLILRAFL